MLTFSDLIKFIRPDRSARVGHLIFEKFNKLFGPVLRSMEDAPNIALNKLNEWSKIGSKLNHMCLELDALDFIFYLKSFYLMICKF